MRQIQVESRITFVITSPSWFWLWDFGCRFSHGLNSWNLQQTP